jgi:hypothetical protein
MKYTATVDTLIDHGEGFWKTMVVGVWEQPTDIKFVPKKIGEYQRNYSNLFNTFFPFMKNGEWYALYSPDYTCTRIMKLPECVDIGGEEPSAGGFCPVDYYVPFLDDETTYADFGFVSGCIWGDDGCMKLEYFDLSKADQGILVREKRFGYLELPDDIRLLNIISMEYYDDPIKKYMHVCVPRTIDIDTGKVVHRAWDLDKNWAFTELATAVDMLYRISLTVQLSNLFVTMSQLCDKICADFGLVDHKSLVYELVKMMIVYRRESKNLFTWVENNKK